MVDARREGDENPLLGVVPETMKLLGNSSYGYQVLNRSRHTITKFVSDEKTHEAINEPLFKRLITVVKELYEVEFLKLTIDNRKPIIDHCWIFHTAACKTENVGALL